MSGNLEQHQVHLREAFLILKTISLTLSEQIVVSVKQQFLRYYITEGGYRPPKEHIVTINNFPIP